MLRVYPRGGMREKSFSSMARRMSGRMRKRRAAVVRSRPRRSRASRSIAPKPVSYTHLHLLSAAPKVRTAESIRFRLLYEHMFDSQEISGKFRFPV